MSVSAYRGVLHSPLPLYCVMMPPNAREGFPSVLGTRTGKEKEGPSTFSTLLPILRLSSLALLEAAVGRCHACARRGMERLVHKHGMRAMRGTSDDTFILQALIPVKVLVATHS